LTPSASDEEVKKAYRKLAMKYHPDSNPGDKNAEQKMKEINAAYDQIVNREKYAHSRRGAYAGYGGSPYSGSSTYGGTGGYPSGSTGNYGGSGNYGGGYTGGYGQGQAGGYGTGGGDPFAGWGWGWPFGGYSTETDTPQMAAVRAKLERKDYQGALNDLNAINDRTARWFYYSSMAYTGLGDNAAARTSIQRAVTLDPMNLEYRMYAEQLAGRSAPRQTQPQTQAWGCAGDGILKAILIIIVINIIINFIVMLLGGGGGAFFGAL